MLLELARLLVVVALAVVLPGALLVNALFPPGKVRIALLERAYLAVAGGVLLVMLVGVTLGLMPHDNERGYFQSLATGAPYFEFAMGALCVALLAVGVKRGAYEWISSRIQARLGRAPERAQS